jgi:hypothetical protein
VIQRLEASRLRLPELSVTQLLTSREIESLLPKTEVKSNFCSPLQLASFCQQEGKKILQPIVIDQDRQILIQIDSSLGGLKIIRVLFGGGLLDEEEKLALVDFYEQQKADLITLNFLTKTTSSKPLTYGEYFLQLNQVLSSVVRNEKKIKRVKDYLSSKKNNPELSYIPLGKVGDQAKQRKLLFLFLQEWEEQTGIEPVLDFLILRNYWEEKIGHAGIVIDNNQGKAVAYSLFSQHPSLKGVVISHENKCLRGYTHLGTSLKIDTIRHVKDCFPESETLLIGGEGSTLGQRHFKESFTRAWGGDVAHHTEVVHQSDKARELVRSDDEMLAVLAHTLWVQS